MAVIGGLAKDPLTGLNKFQQQQKDTQAQYGGAYKPGNIISQPAVGAGAAGGVGAAAGAAVLGAGGGAKPGAAPAVGGAPAAGAGGYNPYAPSAPLAQYQSSYNGPDMKGMTDQLNSIYSNMSASQLQKLKDALAVQLQGYNSQETTANQSAYDNRNNNDVMSMQQMQGLREQMAAQGVNGGDSITAQVANDASRQSGANAINRDQANAIQDLAQKRALAQSQEASGELSLQQQIDSDKAGAMLNLLQYGDSRAFDVDQAKYGRFSDDLARQFQQSQFDYGKGQDQIQNDAQYGGTYKGGQTFAAQQQQIQNDAQYGGTYAGKKTVAQDQQEWNNRFDYGNAIGQFGNGQQTLASKGQQFSQDLQTKNYNHQNNQDAFQNDLATKNYNHGLNQDSFNNGINQSQDDLAWINSDNKAAGGGTADQYKGFTPSQVLSAVKGQLFDQWGDPIGGGTSVDPQKIYETVNSYHLPIGQDEQVMLAMGLTQKQIDAFDADPKIGMGK